MSHRVGVEYGKRGIGLVECLEEEENSQGEVRNGDFTGQNGVLFHKLDTSRQMEASGRAVLNDVEIASAALSFCLGLDADSGLVDSSGIAWNVFESRMRENFGTLALENHTEEKEKETCELILEKGSFDVVSTGPGMYSIVGTSSFSSVRGGIPVPCEGRWMFEVQLGTPGIMQLGWVTPVTVYTSEDGVGDSRDSYAYDGKRRRKWNVESMSYGERWTAGDVISCGIDFENGRVEYWRNGVYMGVAYSPKILKNMSYYPGVSVSYAESCEINFGHVPFLYPVDGFSPILPVSAEVSKSMSQATYFFDCLEKLTIIGHRRRPMSPRAAAAVAARQAAEGLGLQEGDRGEEGWERGSDTTTLLSIVQKQAAAFLVKEFRRVLQSHYVIDSVFLESCRRMLLYDQSGSPMQTFLEMISANMNPDKVLEDFVHAVCVSCGRRVKGNVWERHTSVSRCDAVVCMRIWWYVMSNHKLFYSWLEGKDWMEEFEDFFVVRQPTSEDLARLVPASVDDDVESMLDKMIGLGHSSSDEGTSDAVSEIISFLNLLDDCQAQLLTKLMEAKLTTREEEHRVCHINEVEEALDDDCVQDYLDRFAEDQATSLPRDQWLDVVKAVMVFDGYVESNMVPTYLYRYVKYITRKNLGVNKEVAPPGLSNPSVVCSLHSFIVRACRKFLRKAHLEGAPFNFPPQVFLRGIRSTVVGVLDDFDDDSLDPDARLGGGLSYLCKSSIVDVCNQFKTPFRVPGVEEDERPGDWLLGPNSRPLAIFPEAPAWSWWLVNASFVLFHLGASQMTKLIYTYMQTFEAAMTSYKGMLEKYEVESDRAGTEIIEFTMKECKKTMIESLRLLMWHMNWLMPKWKQETFGALAAVMARILLHVQNDDRGPMLSYVADFYLEGALDMVLACRRSDQVSWKSLEDQNSFYLEPIVRLCISLIRDSRVVDPRAQNAILYSLWMMIRDEDTCSFLCQSSYAREALLPSLIESFDHPRNWIHASNAFGLLVLSSGFSPRIGSDEESGDIRGYRGEVRAWLGTILRQDEKLRNKLFSSLIDRLNWISPEVIIIVEELHQHLRESGGIEDQSLSYRRVLAACDLCYHLVRLLELACTFDPEAILKTDTESELLRARLAELIGWGLQNFCAHSHLNKLLSKIHEEHEQGALRLGRDVRITMVTEILGPYLGILSSLEQYAARAKSGVPALHSRHAMPDESVVDGWHAFLLSLKENSVSGDLIKQCLRMVETPTQSGLQTPPEAGVNSIHNVIRAFDCIESHEGAALEDQREASMAVPDEFLDPILNVLMKDPVILPDSKVTLDRRTIQRHLTISATDPFSRCHLSEEDLIPNEPLKKKLEEWMKLHGDGCDLLRDSGELAMAMPIGNQ